MLGMLGPDVSLEEGWLKSEVKEAVLVIYWLGGPHTDPPPRYRILTVGSCIIQRPGWMRRLVDCYTAVDYRGRLPDGGRIRIRSQRPVVDRVVDCYLEVDVAVDCRGRLPCRLQIEVDMAVDPRGRLPNIKRLLVGSRPPVDCQTADDVAVDPRGRLPWSTAEQQTTWRSTAM